uniref:C-type lectin domain-containing protein n=1 Tax=Panagrolaimus sp. ES5 TaxID=591445 RepID=A0AC34G5L9_9BILA
MWLIILFFQVFLTCVFSTCPNGMVQSLTDETNCYLFQFQTESYLDAKEICTEFNGHLASIHDMFINVFIAEQAKHFFKSNFWFGLTDLKSKGNWSWIDETQLNFVDWDKGQPQNMSGFDCAEVILNSGKWQTGNCFDEKPYVCMVKALSVTSTIKTTALETTHKLTSSTSPTKQRITTTLPTQTSSRPSLCSDKWIYYNFTGACYIVMKTHADSWFDARNICLGKGGDLVSIHNQKEKDFVSDLVPPNSGIYCEYASIGLYFNATQNNWAWTDNTPFNIAFWGPGWPRKGYYGCASSWNDLSCQSPRGLWGTTFCEETEQFICKKYP